MTQEIKDISINTIHESKNYGTFVVVGFTNSHNIEVEFLETGYRVTTQASHIRRGKVRDKLCRNYFSVGFIGDGEYKVNDKGYKVHETWRNMLARCYDKENPAYCNYGGKGVIVCDEWHNFQNFAKWYNDHFPSDGAKYHIDKDIIDRSAMTYSPDTCMFVPASENMAERNKRVRHKKTFRFVNPVGEIIEIFGLSDFCKENNLNPSSMSDVKAGRRKSHKGWTRVEE